MPGVTALACRCFRAASISSASGRWTAARHDSCSDSIRIGRYVLFGADPARPEKRYDLARQLVDTMAAPRPELLALGAVDPERVPLWVNAADAVLVPSDREGFGLATLEALACDVPVLATPHGVAPEALAGVEGAYCGAFSLEEWGHALARQLATADPRVSGRAAARALLRHRDGGAGRR